MKYLMGLLLLAAMSAKVFAAPIHYTGDISGSGHYSGNLDINFGWIDPPFGLNSWGDHVDLWQINGAAGDSLSLELTSQDTALGFSVYFGEITALDLLTGAFDNDGDIGNALYLTGASLWNTSQSLGNFILGNSGTYTLVVGGKDFGGYSGYHYHMDIALVPEPSTWMLLIAGLLGIAGLRRRFY